MQTMSANTLELPNGDPSASDRSEQDSFRCIFACDCGYEAYAYDEVQHDCPFKQVPAVSVSIKGIKQATGLPQYEVLVTGSKPVVHQTSGSAYEHAVRLGMDQEQAWDAILDALDQVNMEARRGRE